MRTLSLLLMLALFFTACQNAGSNAQEEADQTEEATAMQYTLTPFSRSAQFPDAAIESMTFENGVFNFAISNYELKAQTPDAGQKMCANSEEGQHIHLIVDTQPYAAKYDPSFEYEIADGEHYILAFLSRSYHESLKHPAARKVQKVMISDNSITEREEVSQTILFYSRPKGTYVGKDQTEKVMLDFYLVNADLSADGYRVKAEINGEAHLIDKWQPYYIEGLPMGDNTIKLTLFDAEGNTVDTPLNPVERTFTLQEDPAEALEQ